MRRRIGRLHLYQVPGYGPVYRAWQRFLHDRGRCVLRVGPVMDDGRRLWKCSWCGHCVVESAWERAKNAAIRSNNEDVLVGLLEERVRSIRDAG